MRKLFLILFALVLVFSSVACNNTSVKTEESNNPLKDNTIKLLQFNYGDVTIGEGLYKDTYETAKAYYLGMDVDDMLFGSRNHVYQSKHFYIDTKDGKDLGNLGIGQNVLGQWVSGNARFYAALKTQELKERVTYLCDSLYEISQYNPSFSMDNIYVAEKMIQGCLDLYNLCGLQKGLTMAEGIVNDMMVDPDYKDPVLGLGDNGTKNNIEEIEWYILPEVIYSFVDTAKKAGYPAPKIKEYLDFAKKFEYKEFWNIFYNDEDFYSYKPEVGQNTAHFHAYSHLNSFNSAAAAYISSGNSYYLDSMKKFWDFMRSEQELSIGGYGATVEWLMPKDKIVDALQNKHDNFENQCDTYAVYRLGNRLAGYTGEAKYGDWSEKLLYNSTIASLETHDGYAFYYSDLCSKGGKKNLHYSWRWSCCSGSRPLNVNEVLRTIYYNDTKNLYVNLFVNSTVNFKNLSGNEISLTQQTNFPEDNKFGYTISLTKPEEFSVKFRKPEWLKGTAVATVNGESVALKEDDMGWLYITREWNSGDTIELTMNSALKVYTLSYESDYGPTGVFAILKGPVALAASMRSILDDPAEVLNGEKDITAQLKETDTPLVYKAVADEDLTLKPFYSYDVNELYYLHMDLYKSKN